MMIDSVITPDIPEIKFLIFLRNQSPDIPEIKAPDIPDMLRAKQARNQGKSGKWFKKPKVRNIL